MNGILPPMTPPGPEAPGPFSFGDQGRVARILTVAGFTDVAIAPFDASIPFGEGETRDAAIDDAVEMTLEVGRWRALSLISPTTSGPAPRPRFVPPSRTAPVSGR